MTMANVNGIADNKKGEEACKLNVRQTTQYCSRHVQCFWQAGGGAEGADIFLDFSYDTRALKIECINPRKT